MAIEIAQQHDVLPGKQPSIIDLADFSIANFVFRESMGATGTRPR